MTTYKCLCLIVILFWATQGQANKAHIELFHQFMRVFNRRYVINSDLYHRRFQAFKASLARHTKLNLQHGSAKDAAVFGVNRFSDLSPNEFAAKYLRYRPDQEFTSQQKPANRMNTLIKIPSKIDWRDNGSVTAVKDQKSCGACWAFSIVENAESMQHIQHGNLPDLKLKCEGGDIGMTADWLIKDHVPIVSEKEYPLKDVSGTCNINPQSGIFVASRVAKTGYIGIEEQVLALLSKGPVAVAVNSNLWQDYLGGVIQHHCSAATLNHAIQIVGYDMSGDVPYYIGRNSWGPAWGNAGFLKLKIGANICGLATEVISLSVE